MKKIYLFAIGLSVGTLSFGQVAIQNATTFKTHSSFESFKPVKQAPHDKGTTLWNNDFSVPGDWTIASNGDDWVIGTGVPSGAYAIDGLTSTSGGNFALFDSDLLCSGNQDATLTINTPINLTGVANVSMVFEEYYRKFQDQTYVGVSTNGGATWTDFEVNATIGVNDFNGMDQNANPYTVTVNISSAAANQSAVLIRFHYIGGCDYAWMVDDVEIQESDNNDLVISEGFYGFGPYLIPYTRIPQSQITSGDFMAKASNVGAVDQTNVILTADVNGGLFTGTSSTITVPAGATDSLFSTTQYTPANTIGVPLNVTLTVSSDSTDSTPANNATTFPPFQVSANTYALDDYDLTPGAAGGLSPSNGAEFEAGNMYDIFANAFATNVQVYIGTGTPAGTPIEGVLYDLTSGSFVEVGRSNIYTTVAGDVGTVVTLPLVTPSANPAVTAGSNYFAAVHAYTLFNYGVSGSSPGTGTPSGQTSLIYYPNMTAPAANENFYTTQTPMVRLNVQLTISDDNLESNNASFNVYPNPSNGEFNITLDQKNASNVNLSVKNIVGQTIMNKTINVSGKTQETISLTGYSKGIYFLTIDNETVKLVVE